MRGMFTSAPPPPVTCLSCSVFQSSPRAHLGLYQALKIPTFYRGKTPTSRAKESEASRRSTNTSYATKVGGAGVRVKNNRLQHIASQLLDSLSRQVGTPPTAGAPFHLQSKITEEKVMKAFGADAKASLPSP